MESNESLIEEFPENKKPPKLRGCLATILFGKNPSCLKTFLRFLHLLLILYFVITCTIIGIVIYYASKPEPEYEEIDSSFEFGELLDIVPMYQVNMFIKTIELETERVRGLSISDPINYRILNQEDFFSETQEDSEIEVGKQDLYDQIFFETLGLQDKFTDSDQEESNTTLIMGLFDAESEYITLEAPISLDLFEWTTFSHEYTHALQDKSLNAFANDYCDNPSTFISMEKCDAYIALIEGDASLTENMWYLETTKNTKDIVTTMFRAFSIGIINFPGFDDLFRLLDLDFDDPNFKELDLMFPYVQGLHFVRHLYQSGGWEFVNAAYQKPPVSTEQILHPDRYPDDTPIIETTFDLQNILDNSWEPVWQTTLGEWWIYLTLTYGADESYQLPQYISKIAANGWGGDSFVVYQKPQTGERVALLRTSWDTLKDAWEFGWAFKKYGSLRWGKPDISNFRQVIWEQTNDGFVELYFLNNEVIWMITPNQEMASKLLDALLQSDN